uniref:Uncharacterized protein n=1 Tax=Nothoprocta perdicaria TaxID=30464 RepID=A0A8C6YR32_NOTPE
MERANTITYLKGETIGTETRKKRAIKCAATGLFPKNINRFCTLHNYPSSALSNIWSTWKDKERKGQKKKKILYRFMRLKLLCTVLAHRSSCLPFKHKAVFKEQTLLDQPQSTDVHYLLYIVSLHGAHINSWSRWLPTWAGRARPGNRRVDNIHGVNSTME